VATVGILAVLLVLVLLLALRTRALARRPVEGAETAAADLAARLDALEQHLALTPRPSRGVSAELVEAPLVITSLGETSVGQQSAPALPPRAFADAVLRDTVVNAASLAHGVRRALSPQVRHRIRFEMKREVKRSRKERKAEVREALREYRARHRADVRPDVRADVPEGDVA